MRISYAVVLASIVPIVLLLLPHASAAVIGPPVPWTMSGPKQVALGNEVPLSVTGPENGTFSVNATAAPFNESYPIVVETFVLKNTTALNVTIPSLFFTLGYYQIALQVNGATMAVTFVRFVDPINQTQFQQNVSNLQTQINILKGQVQSMSGFVTALQTQVGAWSWLFLGAIAFFVSFESVRSYVAHRPDKLARVRASTRNFFTEPPYHSYSVGVSVIERTGLDPNRIYRSGFCQRCREHLFTLSEIVDHHRRYHKIPNPTEEAGDFYRDQDMMRRLRPVRHTPSRQVKRAQRDVFDLALGDG